MSTDTPAHALNLSIYLSIYTDYLHPRLPARAGASPLLFRGHKFDLRVWAVVTSVEPFRLFLLQDAYPKVREREHRPRVSEGMSVSEG